MIIWVIQKQKLPQRIYYICFGDEAMSKKLEEEINIYVEKYILYNIQLDILITFFNKYYPKSKKEEIDKYTQDQASFKEAKINICNITINENIGKDIEIFEKYEKSQFFGIFYNNIECKNKNLNPEEEEKYKFEETEKIFNDCKKLFEGQDFELDFLEIPLNKLEDNDSGDNLLKEITYLKNYFEIKEADEKQIKDNLIVYKNRKRISIALKSLLNLCIRLSVENMDKFKAEIESLSEFIDNLKNYKEIQDFLKRLKKIDEDDFFEKNFFEILIILNENDELISFLKGKKENETRDLIDGLFDEENEENFTVELKDIEILINVVCFFQELTSKTKNLNMFLFNFHSIFDKKNQLFKEIVSNIVHVNSKLDILQDYIRVQLGKTFKFSTNIEKFLNNGIIKIQKIKRPPPVDSILLNLLLGKDVVISLKEELYFTAIIIIDGKEETFDQFLETINRIKSKNIYKYGKNKENVLKAKKIGQILESILKELNLDTKQEFTDEYKVADFQFVNRGILKLPKLEKILEELRKKNFQLRNRRMNELEDKPALQFQLALDLIDFEELENSRKIESYFPNIKEIEENNKDKIIHKNIQCDGCGMHPLVGIRYKCKVCDDFDYCESCYEANKNKHGLDIYIKKKEDKDDKKKETDTKD